MSRTPDVMDLLADSRPARLNPAEDRHAEAVAAIMSTGDRQRRSRRALFSTVGATAVAAAAAVVAVAVAGPGPSTVPAPPSAAPLNANQLLLAAAERTAAVAPATTGRYLNLQSEYGFAMPTADGSYTVVQRTLGQYWLASRKADRSWVTTQSLGVKPVTAEDEAAWQRAGSPAVVEVIRPKPQSANPKPAKMPVAAGKVYGNPVDQQDIFGIGKQRMTMADLAELPAEPAALRAALLDRFDGGGGDQPTDRGQWLLDETSSLLVDLPVSNAVRAAAFRLLAGLPGVRSLGEVRDMRGRAGQAVAFTQDGPQIGSFEVRLILDPASGQALGRERRAVRPRGAWSWVSPGDLITYQLAVAERYTDDNPPRVAE
jgi:hypothetical protein